MNLKCVSATALGCTFGFLSIATAHAQSSVSLSGYVDTYFERAVTGKGTVNGLGNSALNQSRFVFSGTEDLGGGTKVLFDLEAPFDPNTGAGASALFSRNAYVALHNDHYGELRMGRLTTLMNDIMGAFWMLRWGAAENAFLYAGQTTLNSNSTIRYESPSWYGFVLDAQYSFGTVNSAGSLYEVKGQYDQGPLRIAGGFYRSKSPHDLVFPNSLLSIETLGTSYAFKWAIPYILYQRVFSSDATGAARVDRYNVDVALAIPLGAASLRLDYGITRNQALSHANADSGSVRLDYSLSKRTVVYTGLSKVWNGRNAYYQATSASGSSPLNAVPASLLGKDSTTYILGLRTAF